MAKQKEVKDIYAKRNKESESELLKKFENQIGRKVEDYADAMDFRDWMDDYLTPPEFY